MWALTLYLILNAFAKQVHLSMQKLRFEFALRMPLINCCSEGHLKAFNGLVV